MSDDHKRMNSTKTNVEPSTSASALSTKQTKRNSSKTARKLKTAKKHSQHSDVKIGFLSKTSSKNSQQKTNNANKICGSSNNISNLRKTQECSAGSVVITIRLLKMESTKDFETISMNALQSTSLTNTDVGNTQAVTTAANVPTPITSINQIETIEITENQKQKQNDNDKHLNNNSAKNTDRNASVSSSSNPNPNPNSINNNLNNNRNNLISESMHRNDNSDRVPVSMSVSVPVALPLPLPVSVINMDHNELNNLNSVKHMKSLSDSISICDKIQASSINRDTAADQLELLRALPSSSSDHEFNSFISMIQNNVTDKLCDRIATATSTSSQRLATAATSTPIPALTTTTSHKTARDFIPTNLISTVSPYPHHIPIANILKSEPTQADNNERTFLFLFFIFRIFLFSF